MMTVVIDSDYMITCLR